MFRYGFKSKRLRFPNSILLWTLMPRSPFSQDVWMSETCSNIEMLKAFLNTSRRFWKRFICDHYNIPSGPLHVPNFNENLWEFWAAAGPSDGASSQSRWPVMFFLKYPSWVSSTSPSRRLKRSSRRNPVKFDQFWIIAQTLKRVYHYPSHPVRCED